MMYIATVWIKKFTSLPKLCTSMSLLTCTRMQRYSLPPQNMLLHRKIKKSLYGFAVLFYSLILNISEKITVGYRI